jgi:hypothetical protein
MHQVSLDLTKGQFDKLRKGRPIQLSKKALNGGGMHWLALHPENFKKVEKAKRAGRGVRITLSTEEMENSAEGLKEFFQKIGKFYKEKVKPKVAPFLKAGVRKLIDLGKASANVIVPGSSIALDALDDRFGNQLIDKLGSTTGAYGMGPLLGPNHPAMHPVILPAIGGSILAVCPHCHNHIGGSFRPA